MSLAVKSAFVSNCHSKMISKAQAQTVNVEPASPLEISHFSLLQLPGPHLPTDSSQSCFFSSSQNPHSLKKPSFHKSPKVSPLPIREDSIACENSVQKSWQVKEMVLKNGVKYTGQVLNGECHGKGGATYANGDVYSGHWKVGRKDGPGIETYPDGAQYIGHWKTDIKDGPGTETYPDGAQYVGHWKAGKKDGPGTYTWADGRNYVGQWIADKPEGLGILTAKQGELIDQGVWGDGVFLFNAQFSQEMKDKIKIINEEIENINKICKEAVKEVEQQKMKFYIKAESKVIKTQIKGFFPTHDAFSRGCEVPDVVSEYLVHDWQEKGTGWHTETWKKITSSFKKLFSC